MIWMECTTHGQVTPDAEVVENVIEWHCPQCGEHLGAFIDGGELDLGLIRDNTPNRTSDLQVFFEEFTTIREVGIASMRMQIVPMSRGELIRQWFRTRLSARPWKKCVPVECPPQQEFEINWEWKPHE